MEYIGKHAELVYENYFQVSNTAWKMVSFAVSSRFGQISMNREVS